MILLLAAVPSPAAAQSAIDGYVSGGLSRHPGLAAAESAAESRRAQAEEASRAYIPSLSLQARYTRAGGGRTIEFPVGDLLNPVYGALNELTGTGGFPMIENESIRFMRSREQDTRLTLYQPVFEPALRPAGRAAEASADAADAAVELARRDLARGIRMAYLGALQAREAVTIHESAVALVTEALRVAERLAENGAATPDAVYRARAEEASAVQTLAEARTTYEIAVATLNSLSGRPLDAPLDAMDAADLETALRAYRSTTGTVGDLSSWAVLQDPSMERTRAYGRAAKAGVDIATAARLPAVGLALDAGIQGTGYTLTDDASFRSASVVVRWTLFDGRRRDARIERARADALATDAQIRETERQVRLSVLSAQRASDDAQATIPVAERRRDQAAHAHRLALRRYDEGMANLLEVLDARTALTAAEEGLSIARYGALAREVDLIRVAALDVADPVYDPAALIH